MRRLPYLLAGLLFIALLLVFRSAPQAVTGAFNQTVRIVDSLGNVLNTGTASAVTAAFNSTVRVVNSSGNVMDSLGAPANQFVIQNLGSTTTPACNFNNGFICSWQQGNANATMTATNLPGTVAAPVTITTIAQTSGAFNTVTFPVTFIASAGGPAAGSGWGTAPVLTCALKSGGTATSIAWTWLCDGTQCVLTTNEGQIRFTNQLTSGILSLGGDPAFGHDPRGAFYFDTGSKTAIVASESLGTYKTVQAITIENIEADIKISPTCSVSEVITCFDCGTTAGACTAGQTATISTTTIASAATRQSVDQSITTANVAASHYISCIVTAGTCTVYDNAISMTYRMQ